MLKIRVGRQFVHRAITQGLFVISVIFLAASSAFAQCAAPKYVVGRVWPETEPATTTISISIQLTDFVPSRLICLAPELKARYRDKNINAWIFSSPDAARRYHGDIDFGDVFPVPGSTGVPRGTEDFAKELHGIYTYKRDTHEESLEVKPLGMSGEEPGDTRIDLPIKAVPRCNVELAGRCLISLDYPRYPVSTRETVSGSVTLTGTVTRQGRVVNIQVVEADIKPTSRTTAIVDATLRNLGTARLQPASHEDAIRLTYSYVIDRSLQPGQDRPDFDLPNKITVLFRPLN